MALGIFSVLYTVLMLTNAVAILHEDRFLARVGWTNANIQQQYMLSDPTYGGGSQMMQDGPGVKARLINLLTAVRTLMRIPLIILNTVVIGYELILG